MSIRYRKNINCLTTDELHDLREALQELYSLPGSDPYSYESIAGIHGSPSPAYCEHGYPGFLTWHRAYLLALEDALRRINCDVTLPYWDWSSGPTTGLPAAVSSPTYTNRSGAVVDNPLYSGPVPTSIVSSGRTSRSATIDTTSFDNQATDAQNAALNNDFDGFQQGLNDSHGDVHTAVGGEMGSVPTAGFDPIFYLHHANVDRIWAEWQKTHTAPLPADEAALELLPFTHSIGGAYRTGAEMFSTDDLGYRYRSFCIFVLPWPFDWWIDLRDLIDPFRFKKIKLVFKLDSMPPHSAEMRVFLNDRSADENTPVTNNPNFAGCRGFFGGKVSRAQNAPRRFDRVVDISEAVRRLSSQDGPAELRMVAVRQSGKAMAPEKLGIRGVELHVEP